MKIICISGKAQHGKDTTAECFKKVLQNKGHKVLITHNADLLKYICKTFFEWDGEKNERGRQILQHVGTDVIRKQNPDYWVKFIVEFLKMFKDEWDYILIPDCRFSNEIECFKEAGFDTYTIRVIRNNFISPLTEKQQQHPSETSLDHYIFDYIIYNDFAFEYLDKAVQLIAQHICGDHK